MDLLECNKLSGLSIAPLENLHIPVSEHVAVEIRRLLVLAFLPNCPDSTFAAQRWRYAAAEDRYPQHGCSRSRGDHAYRSICSLSKLFQLLEGTRVSFVHICNKFVTIKILETDGAGNLRGRSSFRGGGWKGSIGWNSSRSLLRGVSRIEEDRRRRAQATQNVERRVKGPVGRRCESCKVEVVERATCESLEAREISEQRVVVLSCAAPCPNPTPGPATWGNSRISTGAARKTPWRWLSV